VDEEPRIEEESAPPVAEEGELVFVVEDDPVVHEIVVATLKDLGYRVLDATDGSAALDAIRRRDDIDLLITDIGLPGLNGRQVAEGARAAHPNLKVLFMTGYAENAAKGSGVLDPGMHMMTKPFAVDEFGRRVRHILENGDEIGARQTQRETS
jgi:DNA-binding response OmpR family regulator